MRSSEKLRGSSVTSVLMPTRFSKNGADPPACLPSNRTATAGAAARPGVVHRTERYALLLGPVLSDGDPEPAAKSVDLHAGRAHVAGHGGDVAAVPGEQADQQVSTAVGALT